QALPSSHGSVLSVCVQPVAGLQPSSVQGLLSLQSGGGPPWHVPPPQVSFVVQALPSSHGSVLFVWVQPVEGLQPSSVQGLLSLQSGAGPPWQVPPPHVSFVVQALPSSHGSVLFVCVQPVAGLQPSSVQGLLSLQFGAGPPWQVPPPHVSVVVQASPSSHDAVLFVWVQPVEGLQPSSVQG